MDKFTKKALNIALAGAVFAGMSLPAYAVGVLATSTLELKNLRFHDDSGTTFSNLNFGPTSTSGVLPAASNTSNISATLNSVTKQDGGIEIKPFEVLAAGGTIADLVIDYDANDFCVGSGCTLVDNDFNTTLMTSGTRELINRSYSDSLLTGTSINYDLNGDGVINGLGVFIDHDADPLTPDIEVFDYITAGSHIGAESTVELITDGLGFADVDTQLTTAVTFIWSGPATSFNISFDASVFAEAFVDTIPNPPESANAVAEFNQTFELVDELTGDIILEWAALDLNRSRSRTDGAPGSRTASFADSITLTSSELLVAGREYSFQATTGTTVTASLKIPEPASVALFGLGLLGLSQIRRKK
ncbi:EDSAP-1 family PEP-CTERM protein [Motilimonas eburnea]|uniref:EDSAP-1 family PEP-CTERM protein n=1 Tax=Motilimonas eburnea TaxID=1737488 RepID=UPI001E3B8C7E|nr:EDSAP-1 family PEP-CTERM protein [Motilimonas eburnea]MCE2571243.1 PEP-CTERM sorting domain-containing protein [Motilimonas eburnea]